MAKEKAAYNNPPVKIDLPRADWVLILGIISIFFSFLGGLPGLVIGIVAIALSKKPKETYRYASELYYKQSFNKIKAGTVMAYIGIGLSIIAILFFGFLFSFFSLF